MRHRDITITGLILTLVLIWIAAIYLYHDITYECGMVVLRLTIAIAAALSVVHYYIRGMDLQSLLPYIFVLIYYYFDPASGVYNADTLLHASIISSGLLFLSICYAICGHRAAYYSLLVLMCSSLIQFAFNCDRGSRL